MSFSSCLLICLFFSGARRASGGYDYSQLDVLLGRLHENRLAPVIEMMTNLITDDFRSNWAELTIRILERYTGDYWNQWKHFPSVIK